MISRFVDHDLVYLPRENIRASGKIIRVAKLQITAAGRGRRPLVDETLVEDGAVLFSDLK